MCMPVTCARPLKKNQQKKKRKGKKRTRTWKPYDKNNGFKAEQRLPQLKGQEPDRKGMSEPFSPRPQV